MDATTLLTGQLNRVNELLHTIAKDVSVETSRTRITPGTNVIGFTLWHVARTADWALNTMILGEPEIAFSGTFQGAADGRVSQFGVGISLEEADTVAHATTPDDVAAYHDRVLAQIVEWLASDPDLTLVPNTMDAHPQYACYRTPHYVAEAEAFPQGGATVAQYLTGPAIGHARGHFGEIETLLSIHAQRVVQ